MNGDMIRKNKEHKKLKDKCPNCEKRKLTIKGSHGRYKLLCENCNVIYFSGAISRHSKDIVFDSKICYECMEYGVRYFDEEEVVKCSLCGEVYFR